MTHAAPTARDFPALDDEFRSAVHRRFGASEAEAIELVQYGRSGYTEAALVADGGPWPLADEPFVDAWERYMAESASIGAAACLRQRLIQLQFPIARGISQTESYRAATRRGVRPDPREIQPLALRDADEITIILQPTPAGRIPVIVIPDRVDFEGLMQALTRRNEPDPIPPSMGASMIAGYNNWDRIAALRATWASSSTTGDSDSAWQAAFAELLPHRELYQDRFILLSTGPYSATPALAVALSESAWRTASVTIRCAHECTHYFTRRAFGAMRNTLVDELIADYMGIVAAAGRFRADWFLRFLGLHAFPACDAGGRVHNYRGAPPLSDGAFAVLQALVVRAAGGAEAISADLPPTPWDLAMQAVVITALARLGLEGLASGDATRLSKDVLADLVISASGGTVM
jgi:hypothetical protein